MNKKRHSTIWLRFTGIIFLTILGSFLIISLLWLILFSLNVIPINPLERKIPIILLFFGSILIGGIVAIYVGKVIIKPIQKMNEAFHEVSEGNFFVRIPENERLEGIKEMAKQFNAMTHDLFNIETLRTDFVANVSHEFKTPIASIEWYATLLQNPNISKENQEMVIDNKEFRLDEQIRKTILALENKWSAKNINFKLDLPFFMYYGSERLLEQVWHNIIDNAIKHSYQDGTIEINIKQESSYLLVTIKDYGEGMNEETIKHIFEKFYQGDSSHVKDGNGLGLALVKRIITICNGEILVQSTLNYGSTFSVKLPINN